MYEVYDAQVKLLLTCLPTVAKATNFALKGGTAINMFIRKQYPRLSVDIDLTYLPIQARNESMMGIESGLIEIGSRLREEFGYKILQNRNLQTKTIAKLEIIKGRDKVKIEPNLILRGSLYPSTRENLAKKVEDTYNMKVYDMLLLAFEEIYAGKICAALDRQHPRDLFDIKFILEEGISNRTKIAFLIYLVSNNRPMLELLSPNRLDQRKTYEEEFIGMTNIDISYEELENIREQLISTIKNLLSEQDKQFLISVKKGEPNWDYIQIPNVKNLPSIKWKLQNISKMDEEKSNDYLAKLEDYLYD